MALLTDNLQRLTADDMAEMVHATRPGDGNVLVVRAVRSDADRLWDEANATFDAIRSVYGSEPRKAVEPLPSLPVTPRALYGSEAKAHVGRPGYRRLTTNLKKLRRLVRQRAPAVVAAPP